MANISNVLNLRILSKIANFLAKIFKTNDNKKSKARDTKFKEIDDGINHELEQQANKLFNPLKNITNKSSKSSVLFVITNAVSVIFGIILLVYPSVSMSIWGLIFLYTGISNLTVAARTTNLIQKIKEKRFKEILFEECSKDEKTKGKTNNNSFAKEKSK